MKLFLCSYFEKVGYFLEEEEVKGKKVAFIPTASLVDSYKDHIGQARELWNNLGVHLMELEISTATEEEIKSVLEQADIIYVAGGNSFYLIDQIRRKNADEMIRKELEKGKLYVGESGGAIICADELSYIRPMDPILSDYAQADLAGLGLVDFYVVPHYLNRPFVESCEQIVEEYANLNLYPINNYQAIFVENTKKTLIEV